MKKIQIWSPEFEKWLLGEFEYDKEAGLVKRRKWFQGTPLESKRVGCVNAQGDWLHAIAYKGEQITVRLNKLAVFLETGRQYHKIIHKDMDKGNLQFDNLVPLGAPLTTQDAYEKEYMASKAQSREEFVRKRSEQKEAARERSREVELLKGRDKPASVAEARARLIEENERSYNEAAARLAAPTVQAVQAVPTPPAPTAPKVPTAPTEVQAPVKPARFVSPEEQAARQSVLAKYDALWRTTRYKRGLFNKGTLAQARLFVSEANHYSGKPLSIEEATLVKQGLTKEAEAALEKWEFDRLFFFSMENWLAKGVCDEVEIAAYLRNYSYKGQKPDGSYESMSAELVLERDAELNRLEQYFDRQRQLAERPLVLSDTVTKPSLAPSVVEPSGFADSSSLAPAGDDMGDS